MIGYGTVKFSDDSELEAVLDYTQDLITIGHSTYKLSSLAQCVQRPYEIREPQDGWKRTFTQEEKDKLRPIAETLAMLDGNAFFGANSGAEQEWYEQYLPEAHALYESNGGDNGWAGEASFSKKHLDT